MDPIHPGSIEDLKEYLTQFTEEADEDGEKATRRHHGDFFHDIRLHFKDLNRDIALPGTSSDIPDGAVGIRGDWDFWIVAYLPYRFAHLSCMEIASCIWPDVKDVVALPDSGEYWWTAKSDDSLQVPGEPFEVWATMRYDDERYPEIMRIETFATADRASAYIRSRPRQDAISHEVLVWTNGERRPESVEIT
jgi:hypothetical protein